MAQTRPTTISARKMTSKGPRSHGSREQSKRRMCTTIWCAVLTKLTCQHGESDTSVRELGRAQPHAATNRATPRIQILINNQVSYKCNCMAGARCLALPRFPVLLAAGHRFTPNCLIRFFLIKPVTCVPRYATILTRDDCTCSPGILRNALIHSAAARPGRCTCPFAGVICMAPVFLETPVLRAPPHSLLFHKRWSGALC
jgi:hypothetical protein